MSEANPLDAELTDMSKCGPPAPGKKWVQVKKTESGMAADGTFFARDYMVWEQVDDVKPAKGQKKEPAQKRAPAAAAKNKQMQAGLASFFTKK